MPPPAAASAQSGPTLSGATGPVDGEGVVRDFGGGISLKWPSHPGKYGLHGAKEHKQWKNSIKGIMALKKIPEESAAVYIQMYCKGGAAKLLKETEFDTFNFKDIMTVLDFHFAGDPPPNQEDRAIYETKTITPNRLGRSLNDQLLNS